ncbi:MAG: HD domain-containing protein [Clostridiales bacterium]|nr:HD domain-containing protein [Clostridiales bacterium]
MENAKLILHALESSGESAYFVGGFVRDKIMGRKSNDIDICTSATPKAAAEILKSKNIKTYDTGLKHGTVTALIGNVGYEITTFRTDGEYKDNRRPSSVEFIDSVETDLARRDFTINAMAYNPKTGIIDLFGGRADIEAGVIRTVGRADKRFQEDALRILRALRFSSELGFEIESETKAAIYKNKKLLTNIAGERIFAELKKLLLGKNVLNVLLSYGEIFAVFIPEIAPCLDCRQNTPWHIYDVWQHTAHSVACAPPDFVVRLTMLFHDMGKPQVKTTDENGTDHFKRHAEAGAGIAYTALRRFNASKALTDRVCTLVKYHQSLEKIDKINVRHMLIEHKAEISKMLFQVRLADLKAHNGQMVAGEIKELEKKQAQLERCIESNAEMSVSQLKIAGGDLKKLGFSGREIGEMLEKLLFAVADGAVINSRAELAKYACDMKKLQN